MKRAAILSLGVVALSTACYAQAPPVEEVVVSAAKLYGDWKMVLPELPGIDKPVTGDFCSFKKREGGVVSIVCADDFLQEVPDVTFDGDKMHMRWGGALNHTLYDAVWQDDGTFSGEIIQAQMGLVAHRFKANMEHAQPAPNAPPESLAVLTHYLDDLASGSVREKYYEDAVTRAMKQAVAKGAHPKGTVKYFGQILEQKGDVRSYPDVFKISGTTEQWCLVRLDPEGLADVRCRDIR